MPDFIYKYPDIFTTESGFEFPQLEIAYHTFGNAELKNKKVIWICHALTANSDAAKWWEGIVGAHRFFNPESHFIVCANILGSCYGTTGPLHVDPKTNAPYYHQFPAITIRDIVKAHIILRKHLGIEKIDVAIGGSLGGQQVLEWAITEPSVFTHIIPIATNARHSPWGIAFNETQRMAIRADATWNSNRSNAGIEGMKAARAIALLSYRHYQTYLASQQDEVHSETHKSVSYQIYQGEKLAKRFNAFSYYVLTHTMDSHNVAYSKKISLENALRQIRAKACCIGLSTDILFPPEEQKFLAQHIPNAEFHRIETLFGHDGFLLEFDQLTQIIKTFLQH